MIALFDVPPRYCPGCGKTIRLTPLALTDAINAGSTIGCRHCDTLWACAPPRAILDCAEEQGGDLARVAVGTGRYQHP